MSARRRCVPPDTQAARTFDQAAMEDIKMERPTRREAQRVPSRNFVPFVVKEVRRNLDDIPKGLQAPGPRRLGKRHVGFCGLGPGDLYLEGLIQLCSFNSVSVSMSVTSITGPRDPKFQDPGEKPDAKRRV